MKTVSPTLLLLPGLLCDETVWLPFIQTVAERVPVFVADFTTQDSLTQMAIDTLAAHDGMIWVAGHSMGARVAMEMARLAPERVQKLALLNTGAHPFQVGEEIRRNQLVELGFEQGMRQLAEQWLVPMVHPERLSDADLMEVLIRMVGRKTPEIHKNQIHALLHRPDPLLSVADIVCPTMVMAATEDGWSPVAEHKLIADLIPNAQLAIIEDTGHFAPLEKPIEVAALLEKWFFESHL